MVEPSRPAPMPSTNRISVTTASATHQKLLEYEAALTGRSISSLASSLLEEILNTKLNEGKLHPTAVRLSEELIKGREHSLKSDHESELVTLHGEAYKLEREWEKFFPIWNYLRQFNCFANRPS